MLEDERRKHPRHELHVKAKLNTSAEEIPVELTNISVDGVQFESSRAVPEGSQVEISLDLGEEALLSGEVVWLLDTYVDGRLVYLVGVEIEAIVLPEIRALGLLDKAEMVQEIISWISDHDAE